MLGYSDLLDSGQWHSDDVEVVGKPRPILSRDSIGSPSSGGHPSTALSSVNYVRPKFQAIANRAIADIKRNIENEQAYQRGLAGLDI